MYILKFNILLSILILFILFLKQSYFIYKSQFRLSSVAACLQEALCLAQPNPLGTQPPGADAE